jgi:hypothetical protein
VPRLGTYTDARVEAQRLHEPGRDSSTEIRHRIREAEPWRDLVCDCWEAWAATDAPTIAATPTATDS